MNEIRRYIYGNVLDPLTSAFPAEMQARAYIPYQGLVGGAMVQAHPRQLQEAINAVAERRAKARKRQRAGAAVSRHPVLGNVSVSRPVAR